MAEHKNSHRANQVVQVAAKPRSPYGLSLDTWAVLLALAAAALVRLHVITTVKW